MLLSVRLPSVEVTFSNNYHLLSYEFVDVVQIAAKGGFSSPGSPAS